MQQIQKYKKTELGDIPEEWEISYLEDACNLVTDGSHFSPTHVDSGFPLATVTNMRENHIDIESCYKISENDFNLLIKNGCNVEKNDVLFSKDGTVGVCLVYNQNQSIVALSSIAIIRPKKNFLDSYFTKYLLQSDFVLTRILGARTGTALKRIILRDLRKIKIPIPSFREQQKIASILSNVDLLIQKTDQIIEHTKILKKGLMQRLLTKGIGHTKFKKVRFYEKFLTIPENWKIGQLKEFTSKIGSGITPRGGSKVYLKEGIPLIRSQNVHFDGLKLDDVAYISDQIDREMKNSRTRVNDVLVNITGASVGRCTFIPQNVPKGNVNQHVCIIRPTSDINSIFLSLYLSSSIGQNIIRKSYHGLSREGLTFYQIGSFMVLLPPITEQNTISEIVNNIDSLIRTEKNKQEMLNQLKKGLMQQLLTGKIRVKV